MRGWLAALLGMAVPLSATAAAMPEDGAMARAVLRDAFDQDATCVDSDFSPALQPINPYARADLWREWPEIAAAWATAQPISARLTQKRRLQTMFSGAAITHDVAHCARAIHFDGPMRSGNWAFVVRHIVCAGLCGRGDALAYHFENGAWRRVVLRPLYAF